MEGNTTTNANVQTPAVTTATSSSGYSYLAVGDSYTIGEAVPFIESYPFQLASQLRYNNYSLKDPVVIARTGWTTENLIDAIDTSDIKNQKFDLVTLLIGVNDQYDGYSQENYRAKFRQVLNTAIEFAHNDKTKVLVLSIPDYGVTPFTKGRESEIGLQIDQFNAINKDESDKAGVAYLNITDISKMAANDSALTANDGLHPSGKMYTMWAQRMIKPVMGMLKR